MNEPFEGNWRGKVRIRQTDLTILICGEHTGSARGVAAQLTISREENKPYFLLRGRPNKKCKKPAQARKSDKIYKIFGEPAFTMDIVDGMQGGYLADVDYRMLVDDIDWDEIGAMSRSGYSVRDLNAKLILPNRDEAMVARVIERMRGLDDARVMCFCRTIDHAERIQRLFQARDVQAGVLHSRLHREDRFRTLANFRNGSQRLVLSVDMLNEGIDVPDVNMVVFMRVTHSRRIFVQQLGRGLRVTPTKNRVVVLDFVADVRRIAAGIELNRGARKRAEGVEVLRFQEGDIVRFDSDSPATFFDEYLRDVASIEDLDESAKLTFPPVSSEHF